MSFSHVMRSGFPEGMPRPGNLDSLRERIRQIEQPLHHGVLPFGIAAIDRVLPGGGLARGAVHEILGAGGDEEDGAAASGFAAALLARLSSGGVPPTSPRPSPPRPSDLRGAEREIAGPSISPSILRLKNKAQGLASFPSPPFRGEREGPSAKRWEGEVGGPTGSGPVLWCLRRADLYGPGLMAHGFDPARLVLAVAPRDDEILWAMEEGLRTPGLAAVIGEIGRLPLVAGRRLQLAAERSGVTALVLRRWRNGEEAATERERPSAAVTRWRVMSLPSRDSDEERLRHLIGRPRWRVELLRCRGGVPAQWVVEVADATGHVRLSPELADRPAAAPKQKLGRREAERHDSEPLQHAG